MKRPFAEEYSDWLDQNEFMAYVDWLETRLIFWRRLAGIAIVTAFVAALI